MCPEEMEARENITETRTGQLASERSGSRLIGITPASDRQAVAPGVVKFTFEAIYAIPLVPPEQTYRHAFSAMPSRVAALARFALGEPDEG